jgi:hypothetical protein
MSVVPRFFKKTQPSSNEAVPEAGIEAGNEVRAEVRAEVETRPEARSEAAPLPMTMPGAPAAPPAPPGGPVAPPTNQGGMIPTLPGGGQFPPLPKLAEGEEPPPHPEGEEAPPHPVDGTPLANVWIYGGEAYDLTEFIMKHPGGEFFIGRTKNRDITTVVNIFHRNPERVKKVLKKYSLGRMGKPEDIHPKCNAPAFLFVDSFNSWQDTPKYNFDAEDQLLNKIRSRVNKGDMVKKIAKVDRWFDWVSVMLVVAYFATQVLRLGFTDYMPAYVFVPLMAFLRISLSGVGHYLIHRPQVSWNKAFANIFDINYVPMTFVVADGHSLLHHPYTQSDVDIKKSVFTAILELPRYYRIPVHTVHKIGHIVTGMFARTFEIVILTIKCGVTDMYGTWARSMPHFLGTFGMRFLLAGELVIYTLHGDFLAWLGQFTLTLWISTFMIVASHDFEESEAPAVRDESEDWAVAQIKNSYDLTMIGNKYVDCFLSAGLSPHRVHHVLPQQRSGFANIISEDIVREEAEKYDIVWVEPKNFFVDRLPILAQHYLFSPSRMAQNEKMGVFKEHFHPKALATTVDYVIKGFAGIGSI